MAATDDHSSTDSKSSAGANRPLLSVVMPVYNEFPTLAKIVERVQAVPIDLEIIAVDDGSSDGSRELLRALEGPRFHVLFHEKNQGKAGALKTGFATISRPVPRKEPGQSGGLENGLCRGPG